MVGQDRGALSLLGSIRNFGLVGITATGVHFVIGLSLVGAGLLGPFMANLVAFLTAFCVSFFGHYTFSFRSTASYRHALPRFLSVALAGLVMNQALVGLFVYALHLPYWLALCLIVVIVSGITFVLSRNWAFRAHVRPGDSEKELE